MYTSHYIMTTPVVISVLRGVVPFRRAESRASESKVYAARVGVWLMPDNRQTGALEPFLRDLINEGDPLLTHAEDSASKAKELGAGYADSDTGKAVLHTWLAWQREPGHPYGVAIKARYFGANSAAAEQFLAWFEQVFGVAPGR